MIKLILLALLISLTACSTVRDTTDWIPGVDSNEDVQQEKQKEVEKAKAIEHENYVDKAVFDRNSRNTSESDAKISVQISQKYAHIKSIKPEDIGIEVNNSVVTLTGNVNSNQSAIDAIAIAKSTSGVTRVISKLVVISLRQ